MTFEWLLNVSGFEFTKQENVQIQLYVFNKNTEKQGKNRRIFE